MTTKNKLVKKTCKECKEISLLPKKQDLCFSCWEKKFEQEDNQEVK